MAVEAPTKACAFCGGPIVDVRRSDRKYCSSRCRTEAFYIVLHPGRSRAGGKHRPKIPRQPELEKRGAIAGVAYYDMPTLAGFDEKATRDGARSEDHGEAWDG